MTNIMWVVFPHTNHIITMTKEDVFEVATDNDPLDAEKAEELIQSDVACKVVTPLE